MIREVTVEGGEAHQVQLTRLGDDCRVVIDGRAHHGRLAENEASVDELTEAVFVAREGDTIHVHAFGRAWKVDVVDPADRASGGAEQTDRATAPMPGVVVLVLVAEGDAVTEGQHLLTIESMKMQTQISAGRDGVVERVHLRAGESFDRGAVLVSLVREEVE